MKSDTRIWRGRVAVIVMAALWLWGGMAAAATIVVTNGDDSPAGTLRYIIDNASNGDAVTFAPDVGTVTISDDPINVAETGLTITGNTRPGGAPATTITMRGGHPRHPHFPEYGR